MKDRATPPPESVASDFLALRRKERRPLNVEQSRTFEAVARHSIGADRRCYASREKLADFAGLHVRNLREALAWLVTEGLIVADGRARDDELPDVQPTRRPTAYRLAPCVWESYGWHFKRAADCASRAQADRISGCASGAQAESSPTAPPTAPFSPAGCASGAQEIQAVDTQEREEEERDARPREGESVLPPPPPSSVSTATDNGTAATATAAPPIDPLALAGEHWCIAIERATGLALPARERARAIAEVRRIVKAEGIEPEAALRRLRSAARLTLDPRDSDFWKDKARSGYGGLLYVFKQAREENAGRLDAFSPIAEWERDGSPAAFESRRAEDRRLAAERDAAKKREEAARSAHFAEMRDRYQAAVDRAAQRLVDDGITLEEVKTRFPDFEAVRELIPEARAEDFEDVRSMLSRKTTLAVVMRPTNPFA